MYIPPVPATVVVKLTSRVLCPQIKGCSGPGTLLTITYWFWMDLEVIEVIKDGGMQPPKTVSICVALGIEDNFMETRSWLIFSTLFNGSDSIIWIVIVTKDLEVYKLWIITSFSMENGFLRILRTKYSLICLNVFQGLEFWRLPLFLTFVKRNTFSVHLPSWTQ